MTFGAPPRRGAAAGVASRRGARRARRRRRLPPRGDAERARDLQRAAAAAAAGRRAAGRPPAPEPEPEPVDEGDATVMPEALKQAPEPRRRPLAEAASRRRASRASRARRRRRASRASGATWRSRSRWARARSWPSSPASRSAARGGGDDGGGEQTAGVPVTAASAGAVAAQGARGLRRAGVGARAARPRARPTGAAYAPGGEDGGRAVAFGQCRRERLDAAARRVPRGARARGRRVPGPHAGQARPGRARRPTATRISSRPARAVA